MRRFFSFRSSTASSGNNSLVPSVQSDEIVQRESLQKKDGRFSKNGKIRERHRSPLKQKQGSEDGLSVPQLRRSLSYSYPAIYSGLGEEHLNYVRDLSPPSCGNSPHHGGECPVHSNSLTPERHVKSRKGDFAQIQQLHATEMTDSPNSSRGHNCSSGNSSYSSPISLKCRTTRLAQMSNKNEILDLYIDGEHNDIRSKKVSEQLSSDAGSDGCLLENRTFNKSGRPPRAQSTAPSSPTFSKENVKSFSFREVKDARRHLYTRDWSKDDPKPISPQKYSNVNGENLPRAYTGKLASRLLDCDSETTTVEDIYEDSSDLQPTSRLNGILQKHYFDPVSISHDGGEKESFGFQEKGYFLGHGSKVTKEDKFMSPDLDEHGTDEELIMKGKEVEHKLMLLSEEDHELNELMHSSMDVSTLFQTIRNIIEDRRCLTLELASQIKCRLADKSSVKEGFRRAKVELDTRTRRLEKEKNELQLTLEKEIDRRSSDWSQKLEKFQSEEHRLRERVRELAEQNVSLQREISSLKGNELDHRSRIINSEMQLNNMTTVLEEVRTENHALHQALSELQVRFNGSQEDLDCIRSSYKVIEKENKDLQKVIVRLQRICSEQDKTINGLRQGFVDEIGKQSVDRVDNISRLQMEQVRLAGVEQILRRELESCRHEIESLRHENICLLDRLKGTRDGCGISFKLESELCAQVNCLQAQGLSLLNDGSNLCRDLVGFLKGTQCDHDGQEMKRDFDYSVAEYAMKCQGLRRGIENFGRSLHTVSITLEEKSNLETFDYQSQTTEGGQSRQSKGQFSEDQVELKLKAETLLTGLLREKLFSKGQELEQLQAELASSVKSNDVLQSEIQRLRDEVSCLTHKTRDTELQILKNDESTNQLRQDLQECTKDLIATRGILMKVTAERDRMWEEVKHSKETIMLLNHEVKTLKKKIEALDEDVLIKEGQISILKDSLGDKPFDTIYSPKSVKEFSLE